MLKTTIKSSFYRESSTFSSLCTHRILRAGHIATGVDHHVDRKSVVGHELIYCLSGAGWVEFGGNKHYVHQGQLVWLPVSDAHCHYPDHKRPWEIYWMRLMVESSRILWSFYKYLNVRLFSSMIFLESKTYMRTCSERCRRIHYYPT